MGANLCSRRVASTSCPCAAFHLASATSSSSSRRWTLSAALRPASSDFSRAFFASCSVRLPVFFAGKNKAARTSCHRHCCCCCCCCCILVDGACLPKRSGQGVCVPFVGGRTLGLPASIPPSLSCPFVIFWLFILLILSSPQGRARLSRRPPRLQLPVLGRSCPRSKA